MLKVVYRINDKYMCIRVYRADPSYPVSIECVPMELYSEDTISEVSSELWTNAEWMILISDDLLQEKKPDGKYYTTDSKGRKEECYLITTHTKKTGYRDIPNYTFNILCPINREFHPVGKKHFVVPSKIGRWFCGVCLPFAYIQKSVHILDLLRDIGSIDECGNPSKIQKTENLIPKSNEIDFTIETNEGKPIYLGICHYCGCGSD